MQKTSVLYKTLVVGVIVLFVGVGIQSVISITNEGNSPPYTPTPIIPDGSICGLLEWYGGDPDGDNVTYDIYFAKYDPFNNTPKIATIGPYPGNQTYVYYQLEGILNFETEYEWKIVSWDEYGLNSTSELCLFETEKNYPPNPAKDPYPPDGATDVPVNCTMLCWNGSDPNQCDILRYDLYFGSNPDPPCVLYNFIGNFYDPYGPGGEWPIYEDFYWRIDTRDMKGLETRGDNWSFITGINQPPFLELNCPPKWPVGKELCLNISSTDPDNHTSTFIIDWGDGTYEETGYYPSNETMEACHTYGEKGVYIIRIRAIDEYGENSNWEECKIEIPRPRATNMVWFQWFLERFPLLDRLLNLLI